MSLHTNSENRKFLESFLQLKIVSFAYQNWFAKISHFFTSNTEKPKITENQKHNLLLVETGVYVLFYCLIDSFFLFFSVFGECTEEMSAGANLTNLHNFLQAVRHLRG